MKKLKIELILILKEGIGGRVPLVSDGIINLNYNFLKKKKTQSLNNLK